MLTQSRRASESGSRLALESSTLVAGTLAIVHARLSEFELASTRSIAGIHAGTSHTGIGVVDIESQIGAKPHVVCGVARLARVRACRVATNPVHAERARTLGTIRARGAVGFLRRTRAAHTIVRIQTVRVVIARCSAYAAIARVAIARHRRSHDAHARAIAQVRGLLHTRSARSRAAYRTHGMQRASSSTVAVARRATGRHILRCAIVVRIFARFDIAARAIGTTRIGGLARLARARTGLVAAKSIGTEPAQAFRRRRTRRSLRLLAASSAVALILSRTRARREIVLLHRGNVAARAGRGSRCIARLANVRACGIATNAVDTGIAQATGAHRARLAIFAIALTSIARNVHSRANSVIGILGNVDTLTEAAHHVA